MLKLILKHLAIVVFNRITYINKLWPTGGRESTDMQKKKKKESMRGQYTVEVCQSKNKVPRLWDSKQKVHTWYLESPDLATEEANQKYLTLKRVFNILKEGIYQKTATTQQLHSC